MLEIVLQILGVTFIQVFVALSHVMQNPTIIIIIEKGFQDIFEILNLPRRLFLDQRERLNSLCIQLLDLPLLILFLRPNELFLPLNALG